MMRITAAATLALALAAGQTALPVAAQQTAPETMEKQVEGNLPEGSLAEKRAGAIGEQPGAVRQGGAESEQTEEEATAPTGDVPADVLMQRRQGAIGETTPPATPQGQGAVKQ